jgi:hypothetical protein
MTSPSRSDSCTSFCPCRLDPRLWNRIQRVTTDTAGARAGRQARPPSAPKCWLLVREVFYQNRTSDYALRCQLVTTPASQCALWQAPAAPLNNTARADELIDDSMPFHPSPGSFKCSQSAMAPVATNALSWRGESGYPLARYRAFLKHAKKFSSHDQQSSRHGVWPTCGPNCAAYIAHNFPGTLGLFCRTLRLRPHMNNAKP